MQKSNFLPPDMSLVGNHQAEFSLSLIFHWAAGTVLLSNCKFLSGSINKRGDEVKVAGTDRETKLSKQSEY